MSPKKKITSKGAAFGKTPRPKAPRKAKRAHMPIPSATGPQDPLTFRVLNGSEYTITPPPGFPAMAIYWEYVLRNRIRWAQNERASKSVIDRATRALATLGLGAARLTEIAKAGVVEIDIPFKDEKSAWELRIFPWEFLLFAATAKERSGPLIVVRHVCCKDSRKFSLRPPKKLMVVESAPGEFGETYSFSSERRLVESNLNLDKVSCPKNPTLDELRSVVRAKKPDVIHLAGFDSHQSEQFLKRNDSDILDGYLLSDSGGNPTYVAAEDLANVIGGEGSHRPLLVSCNLWNSAARIAALIAAGGSTAAIGFQDEIDDKVAEIFFAKFYFNWRALDWDILRAFRLAVRDMHFGGAVVVLWSARSLLSGLREKALQYDADQLRMVRQKISRQDVPAGTDPRKVLDLVVKLKETVNYSLLQNNENLFDEFSVRKLLDGTARDVGVELNLFVGGDSFPYRTVFDLNESYVPLAKNIRFPLTSNLLRSLRESVNSVISIKLTWGDRIRYLDTKPVKLLAIDEWMDTPELDAYLPSFVFPRDRAVSKIIDSAQRYLMALNDDSGAGFDGYQGVDPRLKDPFGTVDLQARAIWAALSYDMPLSYINPPPSFTASSQRLRTPSDVIDGKRGTCVDLALLLAACLEYAGIYPVIFLLSDHAFPGYWRSEEARQDFITLRSKPAITTSESRRATADATTPTPMKPWVFTNYAEVVQLAREGDIVPVETVWLTQHQGFWDAVDEGMTDLRSKREFSSMIDIQGARSYTTPVTPLPILGASL
jgi:hypothetical protein